MIKVFADGAKYSEQGYALAERLEGKIKKHIAIGVGQEGAEKALAEKEKGALAINILDPQKRHDEFDLILMPAHEPYQRADNIIPITGLLNKIRPMSGGDGSVAVLIGGKHIGGNFTEADAEAAAEIINQINSKIFITTSRRTEVSATKKLRKLIRHDAFYDFNYDQHIENPYEEMLARASAIIVSADSARMVSEACSSGKPVYIFTPQKCHFSYLSLRDLLIKNGYAHPEFSFVPTKLLDEAGRVAQSILSKYLSLK